MGGGTVNFYRDTTQILWLYPPFPKVIDYDQPLTFIVCEKIRWGVQRVWVWWAVYFTRVGVEPVGEDLARWSQEAIDLFGELTADKKLVAKPRGLVANRSRLTNEETKVSLELYDTSEGNEDVLIADVLVNKSLARKINEG